MFQSANIGHHHFDDQFFFRSTTIWLSVACHVMLLFKVSVLFFFVETKNEMENRARTTGSIQVRLDELMMN